MLPRETGAKRAHAPAARRYSVSVLGGASTDALSAKAAAQQASCGVLPAGSAAVGRFGTKKLVIADQPPAAETHGKGLGSFGRRHSKDIEDVELAARATESRTSSSKSTSNNGLTISRRLSISLQGVRMLRSTSAAPVPTPTDDLQEASDVDADDGFSPPPWDPEEDLEDNFAPPPYEPELEAESDTVPTRTWEPDRAIQSPFTAACQLERKTVSATFSEEGSIGIRFTRNAKGALVETQIMSIAAGSQASRINPPLQVGLVLVAVGEAKTAGEAYRVIIERIKHSPRPVVLLFQESDPSPAADSFYEPENSAADDTFPPPFWDPEDEVDGLPLPSNTSDTEHEYATIPPPWDLAEEAIPPPPRTSPRSVKSAPNEIASTALRESVLQRKVWERRAYSLPTALAVLSLMCAWRRCICGTHG